MTLLQAAKNYAWFCVTDYEDLNKDVYHKAFKAKDFLKDQGYASFPINNCYRIDIWGSDVFYYAEAQKIMDFALCQK